MEEKIMDINNKFVSEFLDPLRERAKNQRNEELSIERTKNIYLATAALIEANISEENVKQLLIKYWDLRPSEANSFYIDSLNNSKINNKYN